ncbi:MAG: NAD(P)-binding domain-containing protein, partial [Candidatus Saccharicenans sp.]|nr:NAD(P)-binding domain-containing protein [Candidatus Saccharicenans sp.]
MKSTGIRRIRTEEQKSRPNSAGIMEKSPHTDQTTSKEKSDRVTRPTPPQLKPSTTHTPGSRRSVLPPTEIYKERLLSRITSHQAVIGVIGLGYVGLPLVREFLKAGFPVIGFDIDDEKIRKLSAGESYIHYIPSSLIQEWLATGRFQATTDFSKLSRADAIIICVPTPLNENREPDMSYVFTTTRTIAENLQPGQLVVLESTTYPGTTDEDMRQILESHTGLLAGRDFFLAFSPEREDPNNREYTT